MEKMNLILVGRFKSIGNRLLPDISNFINDGWDIKEKEYVVNYLKKGVAFTLMKGIVNEDDFCRFRCEYYSGEGKYFTDGKYVWPEDFIHHVSYHNVMPPKEFISHIKNNLNYEIVDIPFVNDACIEETEYELNFLLSWWYSQKGASRKAYLDPITNVYNLAVFDNVGEVKSLLKKRGLPLEVQREFSSYISGEIKVPYTYEEKIKGFIKDMDKTGISFSFFEIR